MNALEQAVTDPVAEELYQRLMRLQAQLGRPDAVRRTYRLLARQLAELDVDPEPATEQLVADLLRRPGAELDCRGVRQLAPADPETSWGVWLAWSVPAALVRSATVNAAEAWAASASPAMISPLATIRRSPNRSAVEDLGTAVYGWDVATLCWAVTRTRRWVSSIRACPSRGRPP